MAQTDEKERIEQDKRLKNNLSHIKNKIIVISGKGGVGKTTVAVNLAYALSLANKRVGILDIDIHGPNIAKMLGIEQSRAASSEYGIEPIDVLPNLKAISIALLLENQDKPIIWRGPLKMGVIKQFLSDVNWGTLDYLIVDSPPGTGDEPLSAIQLIKDVTGAVIVTTPQDIAILDARKSIYFARELNIPVIGIIENMSGYICPHCHKEVNIFKKGGGESSAKDFKVPFLGSIAFEPEFVELADRGTPFVSFKKELESSKAFTRIVGRIEEFIG